MGKDDLDFLNPDNRMMAAQDDDQDSLVLDLDDVDEKGPAFEVLPVGIYDCVVENTEFGNSSAGNPMISWTLKVIDPQYEGRLLFYHTTLHNEQGRARLKRILLRAYPDLSLKGFSPKKFCEDGDALGAPCRAKVKIGRYQGEKRNSVSDVLAPADAGGFLNEQ
jgi:hypothetical protein